MISQLANVVTRLLAERPATSERVQGAEDYHRGVCRVSAHRLRLDCGKLGELDLFERSGSITAAIGLLVASRRYIHSGVLELLHARKERSPISLSCWRSSCGLTDDVVSAVDVRRFAGDQLGVISRQAGSCHANVFDTY